MISKTTKSNAPLKTFWRVLSEAPKFRLLVLLFLMLSSAALDGVGLLLIVPMLESLNPAHNSGNRIINIVRPVFDFLGLAFSLESMLILFLMVIIMRAALNMLRSKQSTRIQNDLIDGVRRRCYRAVLHAEWRWLLTVRRSDHANVLMAEVTQLGIGLMFGIQLMISLSTMAAYLIAAFALSALASMLALSSAALIFYFLRHHRQQALALGRSMSLANRAITGNIQESLSGIRLAKILGNESLFLSHFEAHLHVARQELMAFQMSSARSNAIYQVAGAFLLVIFVYAGLSWLHMPIATLLTLVFIFSRLLPIFASGQQQYHYWLHALPSVEHSYALIEQAESLAEPEAQHFCTTSTIQQGIRLHQISVHYQGRSQKALDHLSLYMPKHTTTAIMGESGAGKSTLADVLMGLLTIDSGKFEVDGREIYGTERMRWRRMVAYVPQDIFLFNDSIRSNLLWGRNGASETELVDALKRAAAEFVFELPEALDTPVGDGGILLSGGERQRIALARALLKKPALLILDEATSALDSYHETRIRHAIENLHGDLTVLIIGHRIATLEHADQVIVMDKGQIKMQGTWPDISESLKKISR